MVPVRLRPAWRSAELTTSLKKEKNTQCSRSGSCPSRCRQWWLSQWASTWSFWASASGSDTVCRTSVLQTAATAVPTSLCVNSASGWLRCVTAASQLSAPSYPHLVPLLLVPDGTVPAPASLRSVSPATVCASRSASSRRTEEGGRRATLGRLSSLLKEFLLYFTLFILFEFTRWEVSLFFTPVGGRITSMLPGHCGAL